MATHAENESAGRIFSGAKPELYWGGQTVRIFVGNGHRQNKLTLGPPKDSSGLAPGGEIDLRIQSQRVCMVWVNSLKACVFSMIMMHKMISSNRSFCHQPGLGRFVSRNQAKIDDLVNGIVVYHDAHQIVWL